MRVLPDAEWASVVAAEWAGRLIDRPGLRMCLPAGRTPAPLYRGVSRRADFSRSTIFLLDEFGLKAGDPARCDSMLRRDLLDLLDPAPAAFDALHPEVEDIDAECDRFEMALAAGGIDLTLLGLGNNGHLGLNEPGCDPGCPTRKVNLSPETAAGMGRYGAAGSTNWGMTVGLGRLLQSDEIWLLVTGSHKAEVLQRSLQGPIGPDIPASYLRTSPNVVVWADESAAAGLGTGDIPRPIELPVLAMSTYGQNGRSSVNRRQETRMKNEALARLEPLIGTWDLTMSNAWFLDSLDEKTSGHASFEWLDDIFVVFRWQIGEPPPAVCVIGYSDPRGEYQLLYHDDRGVARVFEMEFAGSRMSLLREDSDFHQRFEANVSDDRIEGRWEASEDEGKSWRKDFDLLFERSPSEAAD